MSIGQRVEIPVPLVIRWDGSSQAAYEIKIIAPSIEESLQENCPFKYQSGYTQIPNPGWITFSESDLTLTPGDNKTVKVYVEIPNEERYLGQKWEVWVDVTPKPVPGQTVGMEVFPYMLVQTSSVPPPPILPIILAVVIIALLIAGLAYAIKKGKI